MPNYSTLMPQESITPRLLLRRTQQSDVDRLFQIYSLPEIQHSNPAGPINSFDEAEILMRAWCDHWENSGFGHWAVATIDNPGNVIGFGGLLLKNYGDDTIRLNVGCFFEPSQWSKGYATEMGNAALYTAFRVFNQDSVYARVKPDHHSSQRVLQKLNMHIVGTIDGRLIYQITSTEYQKPEVIPVVKSDFDEK